MQKAMEELAKQMESGQLSKDQMQQMQKAMEALSKSLENSAMQDAANGGSCNDAVGLSGAAAVDLSPDGRDIYVAAYNYDEEESVLGTFRLGERGIHQTGCVAFDSSEDVIDEEDSSDAGGAPDRLRDCAHAPAANGITDLAVAADGRSLVVADDEGLFAFARNRDDGALTPAGCAGSSDNDTACSAARGIGYETRIAITDDGRNAYITTHEPGAIAVMGPAVGISSSARLDRRSSTAAIRVTCAKLHSGPCAGRVTLRARRARSSGARFRIGSGAFAHVSVRLTRSLRKRLRTHPRSRLLASASDARGRIRAVRRPVALRASG